MYAKIFAQIFDSTVNELDLHVRFVWIALLVICDEEGIVDVTPQSIARRINMPRQQVEEAIAELCKADPWSRSPGEEGRRLMPIRETYGWRIVNFEAYRNMRDQNDRRTYMRDYMRSYRAGATGASKQPVNSRKHASTQLAHTEAEAEAKREQRFASDFDPQEHFEREWADYPPRGKQGKVDARISFMRSVTSLEKLGLFQKAKANYKRHLSIETWKQPMNGSRFFREKNWSEWVEWQPVPQGPAGTVFENLSLLRNAGPGGGS